MGDPVTINLRRVARGLGIPLGQVQVVLELLEEGNTVPFITRYRKDQTGGLDEQQIRQIQAQLEKLRLLAERKQTILRSIESQGKLTERLSKQIRNANTAKRLEDLYLPYKPKKQTLATVARSRGLEPLAQEILAAEPGCADLDSRAADFVNPDRQVPTAADALLGAGHIIAEQFSERADLRQRLREVLSRSGVLVSTQVGGEAKLAAEEREDAHPAKPPKADAAPSTTPPQPRPVEASASEPTEVTPEQPGPQAAAEQSSPPAAAEQDSPQPAADETGAQPAAEETGPHASEQTERQASDPSGNPPSEHANEHANEQANGQSNEQANGQSSEQANKQTNDRTNEQASKQANEQANEQADEQANEQASKQANEQADEQAKRQANDPANEQANDPPNDQGNEQAGNQAIDETGEAVDEQPAEETVDPAGERAEDASNARAPDGDTESSAPEQGGATNPHGDQTQGAKAEGEASGSSGEELERSTQSPPQAEPATDAGPAPDQSAEAGNAPERAGEVNTVVQPEEGAEAAAQPPSGPESKPAPAPRAQAPAPPAAKKARPAKADRKLSKKEQKKRRTEEKRQKAFRDYFNYREEIKKIPPHRVLAINRGERAKFLRVRIECDMEAMHRVLDETCVPPDHPHAEFLRGCARDALSRLILPSLEREARRELTERAETHAVGVFARNLRNLLLQPPVRERRVLAVDPGYRSGCKLAALDQFGNLLAHAIIYLVGPPERKEEAKRTAVELIGRFDLTVVTIGNGTACRDAEDFFAGLIAEELKENNLAYVIVNEAGASVYSTSRIGREEFPDYDASLRSAISIGRRLQDPLSELVKIDPASIGVGLYQHDVKAKHLRTSLDEVVESCVNYVGVDVNTASPALLRYVSGLNQLTARRVCEHRQQHGPFRNREQLRDVPGFGEATFVQAAGFLKITGSDNPLDATWIHPESYEVAGRVLAKLGCSPDDLNGKEAAASLKAQTGEIDVKTLTEELQVGTLLLRDILAQLARPGRDPREDLPPPVFKKGVLKLEDLSPGMELTGTVLNVVDFGAFVDIGMHDSGLVHVSQLADRFVRDPHDVVAVGDIVHVWVLEVDKERRRVSLTMIPPGPRRAPGRRESKRGPRRPPDGPKRPAAGDEPRPPRKPRSKGPPRSKGKGAPRPRHKPKSRPKPVTPITDDMKAGKEPMRSFSDLAQFFQAQEGDQTKGPRKSKPRHAQGTGRAPKKHPPKGTSDKPQAEKREARPDQAEPGKTDRDHPKSDKVERERAERHHVESETTEPGEAKPQAPYADETATPHQAPPSEDRSQARESDLDEAARSEQAPPGEAQAPALETERPTPPPRGQESQDEPNPAEDKGQPSREDPKRANGEGERPSTDDPG
jgi:uncharacterized protein